MKIAILGAGAFGTALGGILENKQIEVVYYDPNLFDLKLADAVSGADYILLAAPSSALQELLPELPKNIPLIIATKGILSLKQFSEFEDYMVLSGPSYADYIKTGKPSALTITDERLVEMFQMDFITFSFSDDELGVLLCGALKNIYAILAGLLDLKYESPIWQNYIMDVVKEMKSVLRANHANPDTVDLSCGIDDLKLSCNMPSRNYEFGQKLRQNPNYKPEKTVEGVAALRRIKNGEIIVPNDAIKLKKIIETSDKWA